MVEPAPESSNSSTTHPLKNGMGGGARGGAFRRLEISIEGNPFSLGRLDGIESRTIVNFPPKAALVLTLFRFRVIGVINRRSSGGCAPCPEGPFGVAN